MFSRIIPPYYFLLDNNNWNALTVSESRKEGVGGLGSTFCFGGGEGSRGPIVRTLVSQNLFPGFLSG